MNRAVVLAIATLLLCSGARAQVSVTGEIRKWHRITLTFDGPASSEEANPNPFLDYRLDVTFSNGSKSYTVPGYFAADGNAAESGATGGNKWRVHFAPDEEGSWNWQASFRRGAEVAVSDSPEAGEAVSFDGLSGSLEVLPTDKSGRDLRGKGRLEYVGERYLRFAEKGEYFLKTGVSSPENFLAYEGFDNTPNRGGRRKDWAPHLRDWQSSDPTWQGDKGKGIIGAINYLSNQEQNVFSFLTLSLNGDDGNVFPFASDDPSDRTRMDCSKLDQWEILFEHADIQGMYLHVKTQERENDQLLDGGRLGTQRKLYYRELVARFGHHLALNWNLGEENSNTSCQQQDFASYFEALDPYDHPVVIHGQPGKSNSLFKPLMGTFNQLAGASLQTEWDAVHRATLDLIEEAEREGKEWVIGSDQQGPSQVGVPDDSQRNTRQRQANIRREVLWGNLMAGGAGVEYFFGYYLENSDLTCQNFRTRSNMWTYNRAARDFFQLYLPFWTMRNHNDLVGNDNDRPGGAYCFADPGAIYAVYLPEAESQVLDLENYNQTFRVQWYNPREGGQLVDGGTLNGGGQQSLGEPPSGSGDWVALVQAEDFIYDPKILSLVNPGEQQGRPEEPVAVQLVARGGTRPFSFDALGLPEGLSIDPVEGTITGAMAPSPDPEEPLDYRVSAWVQDNSTPPQFDTVFFDWKVLPEGTCPAAGTPCDDGDPNTANDREDGNCNCVGVPVFTLDQTRIWQEVECSSWGDNWMLGVDEGASNDTFITTVQPFASVNEPPEGPNDILRITVEASLAGNYTLFARAQTSSGKGDSFWFRINGGSWIKWNRIHFNEHSPEFKWEQASGESYDDGSIVERFRLEEGENIMELSWREPGIKLDKFLFSGEVISPSGMGPEFSCSGRPEEVEEEEDNVTFRLYPNPANNQFTMEGEWSGGSEITDGSEAYLFDALGRLIARRTVPPGSTFRISWDIYHLSPGVYLVQVGRHRERLLINR